MRHFAVAFIITRKVHKLIAPSTFRITGPCLFLTFVLNDFFFKNCFLNRLIKSWWTRDVPSEYLPPVSKSEPTLLQFLDHYQLGPVSITIILFFTLITGLKYIVDCCRTNFAMI